MTIVSTVSAAEFAIFGAAKVSAIAPVRARAQHSGFTPDGYRGIGVLEPVAAAGVLIGLARPETGVAAAAGSTMLMAGAVAALAPAAVSGLLSVAHIVATSAG